MERRLAAILAADVVGYSRLIAKDEARTLHVLEALLEQEFGPAIARFGGRIVKLMGDGLLAEFQSAVSAVTCAAAIQRNMAARNLRLPESDRIIYRMGINIGDIVVQDGDLFGDGVNVAARLERMAQPGGITISANVHEQLSGRTELRFQDGGERNAKNMARPLAVWHWTPAPCAPQAPDEAVSEERTIAVLPFDNMSSEFSEDYFSDGITEDIITGLSKNPDIFVISRNSSFTFKGKPMTASAVGKKLGARFVLEGSVRKAGPRVRVTAQLIDSASDRHLWAERYDRDFDDIFAVQDDIVGSIVHAIGATDGVLERQVRQAPSARATRTAYDCYLRARASFYRSGDSGFEEAETLLKRAISLDPDFGRAYSALAWLYFVRFKLFFRDSFAAISGKSLDLALQSVRLNPEDYRAHWVLGMLYLHQRKHEQSLAEFDRALQINPNDANLLVFSTEALIYSGRAEQALERCRKAMRLNPHCPDWYWWQLGFSYFHLGRYEEAAQALERMSAPETPRRLLAATYAHLGRLEDARGEAQEFLKSVPNFTISGWSQSEPYTRPEELLRYVEGLRLAGLPE